MTPPATRRTAALLGNPNTGKTTLFNALSGLNQRVGNYPGVTVESRRGNMTCGGEAFDLIDLPGTYSLAPRSLDEMVAVDVVLGRVKGEARPDVLVCIADASNLERNLYLTSQALELGVPVVVALNMIDVASGQGISIDAPALSAKMGVPVVPIQANRKTGLDTLRDAVAKAAGGPLPPRKPTFPPAFEGEVGELAAKIVHPTPAFLVRRALLDVDGFAEKNLVAEQGEAFRVHLAEARERLKILGVPVPAVEARARYTWIREALSGVVTRPAVRPKTWTDTLDHVLTHRVWGTLIFLAVMFGMFQSIYTLAKPLMKGIDAGRKLVASAVTDVFGLETGPFTSLLTDGVIGGVGSVVIFLPQILILFAFIAVLEDCGYMARAAFLMDRLMSRCGLSGKSFIPLLSSVACAIPGIMATRVIEDRRDRLATMLVAPLMTCSARLPLYILLVGAFLSGGSWWLPGVAMFALYLLGIVAAVLVASVLKKTLLRGATPVFVLEMPAYKRPGFGTVTRRVLEAGWMFLARAGTVILACSVLVWVLLNFPANGYPEKIDALRTAAKDENATAEAKETAKDEANKLEAEFRRQSYLGRLGQALGPVARPLGWDWRVTVAAVASFPAREVVVTTMGQVFQLGEVDVDKIRDGGLGGAADTDIGKAVKAAEWEDEPGRKLFTVPTVLSLLVFFALCCQCASTLAVIRRESGSWGWAALTFVYMTGLAYVGALVVYQVGTLVG